jgi:hypothetical protein
MAQNVGSCRGFDESFGLYKFCIYIKDAKNHSRRRKTQSCRENTKHKSLSVV